MITKRHFIALLFAAAIAGAYSFMPADGPIDKLAKQLANWLSIHPIEKVYLQFDKPNYAAGDDIWFKAYVVEGAENKPSIISGAVNVDLVDSKGRTTIAVKLPLKDGTAAGDFALPDTLRGGSYFIRAYTNYMRNAGPEYYFSQSITVVNSPISNNNKKSTSPQSAAVPSADAKPDLQFFPEGGELVAGLKSDVAFKCVGANGFGLDVQGVLLDGSGQQVLNFNSSHLGMGKFSFAPAEGKTYSARITTADGASFTYPLPIAKSAGYILHIPDATADNIEVQLKANSIALQSGINKTLYLIAQGGGQIYYSSSLAVNANGVSVSIPNSKFPTGIVQFTVFTEAGEPLLERLAFIKHPDKLALGISQVQNSAVRQKVTIGLDAKSEGAPVAGNFSVAVIDESTMPVNPDNENHIMASLLLKSELNGFIEDPAYYFERNTPKALAHLDLLMLTQGYRRFSWKQLNAGNYGRDVYKAEQALSISGTITTPAGKPVPNGKVQVINIDNATYTLDTLTDANGHFAFTNLDFDDSIRFIVQARTANNKKDVKILLDSVPPETIFIKASLPELSIDKREDLAVYTRASRLLYQAQRQAGVGNHIIPLAEVIIREKRIALKHSANLNGPGNADQVLLARDLMNFACPNFADCLQGRLLGVTFRNGRPYSNRGFGPMQVIIDGIYVGSDYLNSVNYNDVAAVEVLRNASTLGVYGGRAANGVILITTKRGDEPDNSYDGPIAGRGIKPFYPKGYYKAREFYSPRYDDPKVVKTLADLRTTIYWNPTVKTGADGKTSFEYFNAGSPGTYRIIVEGIDANGNPGRAVYRYKVQ
ncbi:TonB-dependent receptor plug domain-containing protein [Mucilaginibacter pedocola]|uniref:TonB-dependent receptor plug domain-containing protein n=1 Tax=Mucilaginibacter pedocola TaxID=1792845 RepID=A0A1S9PBX9_9SPHI|nr:TonB-dependent receptor plug domain-containing protein [Mucilaginibacter pedocola]OOQ58494.1 hypothetical protein BC343_07445 [Mucilaginibacter pedocola]